jgi:hypothetical protein
LRGENTRRRYDVREIGAGKTFGPKREEVTEGWMKLPKEELHDLFLSSVIIRVIK